MSVPSPHFRLCCESQPHQGRWRFVLQDLDGDVALEAADREACNSPERLELLAVVRGLEALDQPSNVTLVVSSRYVQRGLRWGLEEWRANGWTWERFGQMVPIKHRDLWQRLDRAMKFHRCEMVIPSVPAPALAKRWRFDAGPSDASTDSQPPASSAAAPHPSTGPMRSVVQSFSRRLAGVLRSSSESRRRQCSAA